MKSTIINKARQIARKFSEGGMVQTGMTRDTKGVFGPGEMRTDEVDVQNIHRTYNLFMSEFSNLTPDNLHFYTEALRRGLPFWMDLLFEEVIRRDTEIGSNLQTRKLAVVKEKWQLSYPADSKVPKALQDEIIAYLKTQYRKIKLHKFIKSIVEAQIKGIKPFELNYEICEGKIGLKNIKPIPNHLLLFDDINNEYKFLQQEKADALFLRTLSWNHIQDRIDIAPLAADVNPKKILIVQGLDGDAQNGSMNGCWFSLLWAFLFKHYGLKDWGIYVERFAIPGIVAKYPVLMNADDKAMLKEAVNNYGHIFKLMIPEGTTFDTMGDKDKGNSSLVFTDYIGYWDRAINKRILGQTLTSGSEEKGSQSLGVVHNQVREDIKSGDMTVVVETMNELNDRLVDMNWGEQVDYPQFEYPENVDSKKQLDRSSVIKNIHDSGWKTKQEDVEKEFGIHVEPVSPGGGAYAEKFIEENFG